MDTLQFYVIETGKFSETISLLHLMVQLNNFASMSNCPLVQVKSNKPPPPPKVSVWGAGEEGGANSYSMILPQFLVSLIFMNMQMR